MRHFLKRKYFYGPAPGLGKVVIFSIYLCSAANAAIPSTVIFEPILDDYHEGFKKPDKLPPGVLGADDFNRFWTNKWIGWI